MRDALIYAATGSVSGLLAWMFQTHPDWWRDDPSGTGIRYGFITAAVIFWIAAVNAAAQSLY